MNAPPLSPIRGWILCLVATFTMAISYIDRQTLAVVATSVQETLHIGDHEYGWLVSAFSIAYLLGAPLAGRFVDALGARRGLLIAVLAWSAVAAAHALTPSFGVLFLFRILLGAAESPSFPGAAQTVYRALPERHHSRGIGVLFTGSSIGAMVAPLLGAALLHRFGWRGAFLGTALVGLVWVPIWFLTAFSPRAKAALDRNEAPTPTPAPRASMLRTLAHPAVYRAAILVVASSPTIGFLINWGPKMLEREGVARADIGHYLWLPPLAFDVGAILFGDLAARRRAKRDASDHAPDRWLIGIAAFMATSLVLYPFHRGAYGMLAIASIAMAGGGAIFALLTADMLARVAPGNVAAAGGVTAAAQSLAYILCNPLVGLSVEQSHAYNLACVSIGALVAPGALIWMLLPAPPRHGATADRAATSP